MALFSELQLTWRDGGFNWDHFNNFSYIRESGGNNEAIERAQFNYHTRVIRFQLISRFLCCVVFIVQQFIHEWAIDDKLFCFKINNSRMFWAITKKFGEFTKLRRNFYDFVFNLSLLLSTINSIYLYIFFFCASLNFSVTLTKINTINCVKEKEKK